MSSLDLMQLSEALTSLKDNYQSFGIKTLIVYRNKEWINVYALLFLSKREIKNLIEENANDESRVGKIDLSNLKIIFQARDIEDLETVLNEIQTGYLKIGEINTRFHYDTSNIMKQKFKKEHNLIKTGEMSEYEVYSLDIQGEVTPNQYLLNVGISPTVIGLQDFNDVARSWFKVDGFNYAISLKLIIPLYAKIISTRYDSPASIVVDIKIHETLLKETLIWIIRRMGINQREILNRSKYDAISLQSTNQDNFAYLTLTKSFEGLNTTNIIEVTLQHKKLGILHKHDLYMSWIERERTERTDLLIESFKLFDARALLESNLRNPANADDFETAISWLFQLFGYRTLHFNKSGERITEKLVIKSSADLIMYYIKENKLYCIDCTVTSPPSDKIDKIKHTSEYISRKINTPVTPLIISAIPCPSSKKQAKEVEVTILDYEDVQKLLEIYQNGPLHFPRIQNIMP